MAKVQCRRAAVSRRFRKARCAPQRIEAFQRYWLGFDNAQTVAIHAALKALTVPTLIVWGLQDIFFDRKWAYWLRDTIPGARRVVEIEDARLFFPEDRPDAFATAVLEFWDELGTSRRSLALD
jgi:pimeloyl-ACP methyl ester carboxylesterase